MRVLLTGFEPFGGSDINSSWEVANKIGQLDLNGVDVVLLPVSFIRAGELIREFLQTNKPDALVMLGQRGRGGSIDIERTTGDIKFNGCDASELVIVTDTGNVKGTLLSDKVFIAKTDTGSIKVPETVSGGKCKITTDTGDIKIEIK